MGVTKPRFLLDRGKEMLGLFLKTFVVCRQGWWKKTLCVRNHNTARFQQPGGRNCLYKLV